MGTAADVSKHVASVVLVGNELLMLDRTIEIAQRVRTIIKQNFWGLYFPLACSIASHWAIGTIGCAVLGMAFAATGFVISLCLSQVVCSEYCLLCSQLCFTVLVTLCGL